MRICLLCRLLLECLRSRNQSISLLDQSVPEDNSYSRSGARRVSGARCTSA